MSENVAFGDKVFGGWNVRVPRIYAPDNLDCSELTYEREYVAEICDVKRFNPNNFAILDDFTIVADDGKTLLCAPIFYGADYAIPEGVTKILTESFWSMDNPEIQISTLTIPSSITEIESDAFKTTKIDKVVFTDWTKWYPYAKLGNVCANPYWNSTAYVDGEPMVYPVLPEGITEIPDYINYGLQFKDEIEIPRSIKRIGAYAFYNNKELYSVILPRVLEEIGESAFEGCELLENPTFPTGLKKIEDAAYYGCSNITEIVLPEGLTMLGSRPSGEEVVWNDDAKGTFSRCTALEKAVVAVDIDYLSDYIFRGCSALDKIYFPLNLKTIGKGAFTGCTALEEVTFPATLEVIGERAFSYGNAISKLVIPDAVTSIGEYSFSNQQIANLTIGSGIEYIPKGAFAYNQLKIVNFPDGLKEIGGHAFEYCGNIGSVILPSSVTKIGDYAFDGTSIDNLVIPDEIETLGMGSCGIPSVLTIGSYVKDIHAKAFKFDHLYTLRVKAHMPPNLSDAFPITDEQNDQLTLIVNDEDRVHQYSVNARWKQIDNIIADGDSEVEIYLNPDGSSKLSTEIRLQSGLMPASVTKMMVDGPLSENDLLVIKENMKALTSLDLSNVTNLTELPESEFEGSLLTEIILPSNLETIAYRAFRNCQLLNLTELPESVKLIGADAFENCPNVNIKTLPTSLEVLGYAAFRGSGIREIVAAESLSSILRCAFQACTLLERADLSSFALTEIPDELFFSCKELDEVILPSTVKKIGRIAFSGTAIRNIDFIPDVTEIGEAAFSDNRRLVSATLPATLTKVERRLFENCPRLISVSMPMTTTEVGENMVRGDKKLANLSCSAPDAPAAESGAFNGIRNRYVTLTLPTLSFAEYLDASQWGGLNCFKNSIKVNMKKGIKVTNAGEKEYKDMLAEDALEAAQDAAAAQSGKLSPAGVMRRAAARAKTADNFATLFDGAQLSSTDGGVNRIFITPKEGVNVTSILFEGEEMLDAYDGQSILLPEGVYGSLEIFTDAAPVIADNILLSETELTLTANNTTSLTASVFPADADDTTVTWSSSDESIATVDENGEVTVVGVGNVTITASCGNAASDCVIKCYPALGDADWSGNITITDAVDITNYVVKKKTAPEDWDEDVWTEFYEAGANANNDDNITFADASATARLALEQPVAAMQNRVAAAYSNESSDALVIGNANALSNGQISVAINLDNSMDYVALQADFFVPEGMEIEVKAGSRAANHSLETMRFDDNRIRVVLFNLGGKAFAAGNEPLLEIVGDASIYDVDALTISNILASDSDAKEYMLRSKSAATGVEGISNGSVEISKAADGIHIANAEGKMIEIYTMDGKIVKSFVGRDSLEIVNLPAGVYVVKAADKNLKVIL